MAGLAPTIPSSGASSAAVVALALYIGGLTLRQCAVATGSLGRRSAQRLLAAQPRWQLLAARREKGGEPVGGQARLVKQQAAHLVEHVFRKVVAGSTLLHQPPADGLQTAVAQVRRLPGNRALVD